MSDVALLKNALMRIRTTPPRIIASPATQPRRAAVALIIRIVPSPSSPPPPLTSTSSTPPPPSSESAFLTKQPADLQDFFAQAWVNDPGAHAELLFLRREQTGYDRDRDAERSGGNGNVAASVAFPGGRKEEGDEGGLYTAMRQTWEETGIDLAKEEFVCIGQLDDREITTALGKRLLMILSPFVFLQVTPTPTDPAPDPAEGTHLHWITLSSLLASSSTPPKSASKRASKSKRHRDQPHQRKWTRVDVDVSSRLTPRHFTVLRWVVRMIVGSMQFNAIRVEIPAAPAPAPSSAPPALLPSPASAPSAQQATPVYPGADGKNEPGMMTKGGKGAVGRSEELKLWGLTLGMTLDLIAYMTPATYNADYPRDELSGLGMSIAPSMTSVVPRFSYPDVNFWIWVFGKRYRQVLRGWEQSMRAGGANDKRLNWAGMALNTFYAAVRKALVVIIILRAIGLLAVVGLGGWWFFLR